MRLARVWWKATDRTIAEGFSTISCNSSYHATAYNMCNVHIALSKEWQVHLDLVDVFS